MENRNNGRLTVGELLCAIAVCGWATAFAALDRPLHQAPPIVSYLTFTGYHAR